MNGGLSDSETEDNELNCSICYGLDLQLLVECRLGSFEISLVLLLLLDDNEIEVDEFELLDEDRQDKSLVGEEEE